MRLPDYAYDTKFSHSKLWSDSRNRLRVCHIERLKTAQNIGCGKSISEVMDHRLRRETVQGRQIQRKQQKRITFFVL